MVLFKINGYYQLWPEHFGTVEVIVGEPINFKSNTSYEEATEVLRQSIINLK